MNRISKDEVNFIKKMIYNDKRIEENSNKLFIKSDIYPQADISVLVTQGETMIEIICKYVVTENIQNLTFNGSFTIFYENEIMELFNKYNIAPQIELKVIKDGGNVYGIFHEGLRRILQSFVVPNVDDFSMQYNESIELPECRSFAVFDDVYVSEPIKYEEMSCDAVVNVFLLHNKVTGFVVQKSKKLDPFVLQDILSKVQESD